MSDGFGVACKVRVVVPTTNGPVDVIRMVHESAALRRSTIRLNMTTAPAGIDAGYNEFVNAPGGVIERLFAHNRFRIDVSGPIDGGESWQLALLLAHALFKAGRLAMLDEPADAMIWATGAIRADISVAAVGEVSRKLELSQHLFDPAAPGGAAGIPLLVLLPQANASDEAVIRHLQRLSSQHLLRCQAVASANEAVGVLGLPPLRALAADTEPTWQGNPYRGLQQFDTEHEHVFCGRAKARAQALQTLLSNADQRGHSFLLLLGASGSGKSSLARAGLVPDLIRSRAGSWRRIVVRPGAAQSGSAEALLAEIAGTLGAASPDDINLPLDSDDLSAPVQEWLSHWAAGDDGDPCQVVLVVDQLEELFTGEEPEALRYGAVLEALASSGMVWIITTLRSDLYHLLERCPALLRLVQATQAYTIPPFDRHDVREIIRDPAARAGVRFEVQNPFDRNESRSLADRIEDDAIEIGARGIGLLQFALAHLYERRQPGDNLLTHQAYDAMGGLDGAIAFHAEKALKAALAKGQNRIALEEALNGLLLNLVTIDTTVASGISKSEAMSRPYVRAISFRLSAPETTILEQMLAARLVTREVNSKEFIVRLAHEALVSHWNRIRDVLERYRDTLILRDQLAGTARRWVATQDRGLLLHAGLTYDAAIAILSDFGRGLEPEIVDFVRNSIKDRKNNLLGNFALLVGFIAVMAYMAFQINEIIMDLGGIMQESEDFAWAIRDSEVADDIASAGDRVRALEYLISASTAYAASNSSIGFRDLLVSRFMGVLADTRRVSEYPVPRIKRFWNSDTQSLVELASGDLAIVRGREIATVYNIHGQISDVRECTARDGERLRRLAVLLKTDDVVEVVAIKESSIESIAVFNVTPRKASRRDFYVTNDCMIIHQAINHLLNPADDVAATSESRGRLEIWLIDAFSEQLAFHRVDRGSFLRFGYDGLGNKYLLSPKNVANGWKGIRTESRLSSADAFSDSVELYLIDDRFGLSRASPLSFESKAEIFNSSLFHDSDVFFPTGRVRRTGAALSLELFSSVSKGYLLRVFLAQERPDLGIDQQRWVGVDHLDEHLVSFSPRIADLLGRQLWLDPSGHRIAIATADRHVLVADHERVLWRGIVAAPVAAAMFVEEEKLILFHQNQAFLTEIDLERLGESGICLAVPDNCLNVIDGATAQHLDTPIGDKRLREPHGSLGLLGQEVTRNGVFSYRLFSQNPKDPWETKFTGPKSRFALSSNGRWLLRQRVEKEPSIRGYSELGQQVYDVDLLRANRSLGESAVSVLDLSEPTVQSTFLKDGNSLRVIDSRKIVDWNFDNYKSEWTSKVMYRGRKPVRRVRFSPNDQWWIVETYVGADVTRKELYSVARRQKIMTLGDRHAEYDADFLDDHTILQCSDSKCRSIRIPSVQELADAASALLDTVLLREGP